MIACCPTPNGQCSAVSWRVTFDEMIMMSALY